MDLMFSRKSGIDVERISKNQDVRMRGFASRTTVEATWKWIDETTAQLPAESVPVAQSAGRILAEPIISQVDVPGFRRSMMDGYGVRSDDTLGAGPLNRLPLNIVGEILPGEPSDLRIGTGEAIRIMTGAALPESCDAVVPVEHTELDAEDPAIVHLVDAVTPTKNVGRVGEDVAVGTVVLPAGRHLRPQDVGVLASVGCGDVPVVRRPVVRIVVTGNELLPPGSKPQGQQIVDANSPMLAALIARDGGEAQNPGIVADDPVAIAQAMQSDVDVVLVSGGSSVGKEDHAPRILAELGELKIHGIAMRPSSPAGMGQLGQRLVFLLPGNPVSCLCAYDFFAGRAIRSMAGRSPQWPYRCVQGKLSRKLVSTVGRVDYARVQLQDGVVEPIAISGASVLSSTTRANGFVVIAGDSEGYPEGQTVDVYCY